MKEKILVIYGGKSVEHDISIITALQAMNAIDKQKYCIIPIYITREGKWVIPKKYMSINTYKGNVQGKKVSLFPGENLIIYKKLCINYYAKNIRCALICCHGTNVEDGCLQGLLQSCNIAYTCSGILSSAIGMDKVFMKEIFKVNSIPCVDYKSVIYEKYLSNKNSFIEDVEATINYPMIVKPANLGSSIGISKCNNTEELKIALEVAFKYDKKVLVEEIVKNLREINIAVLGNYNEMFLSDLEEPINWETFLSFDEKYIKNKKNSRAKKVVLKTSTKEKLMTICKKVFEIFELSGVVRMDFLLNDKENKLYLNEINTIPGSLANYLFKNQISYTKLIDKLIDYAVIENEKRNSKLYNFKSIALDKFDVGTKNK